MLKEIQLLDLFDTALGSKPAEVNKREWRKLAGAVYGAMRRGRSADDILGAMSLELRDTRRDGSKKEKKAVEVLTPYLAQLVADVNSVMAGTNCTA
jgi:hypothetical protein